MIKRKPPRTVTFPWNFFCYVICGGFNDSVYFYDSNQMIAVLQFSASIMSGTVEIMFYINKTTEE